MDNITATEQASRNSIMFINERKATNDIKRSVKCIEDALEIAHNQGIDLQVNIFNTAGALTIKCYKLTCKISREAL